MSLVEVWQVPILDGFAAHTFVGDSDPSGNPPSVYFACWGSPYVQSPDAAVVSGNINYNLANCYRDPLFGFPDTAGIGIYGVNGVCHQSANCFLYSANVQLNFSVLGYWASLLAYGPYGTNFLLWLAGVYGVCSSFNPSLAPEMPTDAAAEASAADKIRNLYASYMTQANQPNPHDRLIDEAATVTQYHVPEADPSIYRDLHAEFLNEKDAVIATGITGLALADQLNSLSTQLQGAIAQRVGAELYKKLNGVDAGQTLNIIDPRLAAIAGRPVPSFQHGLRTRR
jgi:hypothetical protein